LLAQPSFDVSMAKQSSQRGSQLDDGTSFTLPRLRPTKTETEVIVAGYHVISEELRVRFGDILIEMSSLGFLLTAQEKLKRGALAKLANTGSEEWLPAAQGGRAAGFDIDHVVAFQRDGRGTSKNFITELGVRVLLQKAGASARAKHAFSAAIDEMRRAGGGDDGTAASSSGGGGGSSDVQVASSSGGGGGSSDVQVASSSGGGGGSSDVQVVSSTSASAGGGGDAAAAASVGSKRSHIAMEGQTAQRITAVPRTMARDRGVREAAAELWVITDHSKCLSITKRVEKVLQASLGGSCHWC